MKETQAKSTPESKQAATPAAPKKKASKRPTELGTYTALAGHDATVNQFTSSTRKRKAESVLDRPTERTKRLKGPDALSQPKASQGSDVSVEEVPRCEEKKKDKGSFRLMDLPKSVREKIWKEVVVFPSFFVWPDSPTGKEQPDLAMVSRQIRQEVLPIYYAENIFAVDVGPPLGRDRMSTAVVAKKMQDRVTKFFKWTSVLEEENHYDKIRKWAFSFISPTPRNAEAALEHVDKSFVVVLKLEKSDSGFWSLGTGGIEIHRDACCVLPAKLEFGLCKLQYTPDWLNGIVGEMLDLSAGGSVDGKRVVQIAKSIMERVDELAEDRCLDLSSVA